MERDEYLYAVFERLLRMKNEHSCSIFSECGCADMTVKQIAYLKLIGGQEDVTFSRLAELTRNSKPTITELVNRFVRMECVYRETCPDDGRIFYIRLTEKGRKVATADEAALRQVVGRLLESLDEHEIDLLTEILRKAG